MKGVENPDKKGGAKVSAKYQMVACIGLRKENSSEMVTVPLYIKLINMDERELTEQQEGLIHAVSEAMMQRYEKQIAEFINSKKQGEKNNGENRSSKTH